MTRKIRKSSRLLPFCPKATVFVGGEWDGFETVRVIDDSREDGGISASPSALKGAA